MNKKTFTLIELLIVVAIIAILISIMLPSLSRVREKARVAVCLSNLSQMGKANAIYIKKNNDTFYPAVYNSFGQFWLPLMAEDAGEDVFVCPSAGPNEGGGMGDDRHGWSGEKWNGSWIREGSKWFEGSYGLNGWLYSNRNSDHWKRLSAIETPSQTPLMSSSMWVDSWPKRSDTIPTHTRGDRWSMTGRSYINRHYSNTITMSQNDGSAARISISRLHRYDWHRDFVEADLAMP